MIPLARNSYLSRRHHSSWYSHAAPRAALNERSVDERTERFPHGSRCVSLCSKLHSMEACVFIAGLRAVTQSFSECRGSSVRSGPLPLLPPRPVPTAVPLRPRVARPPLAELAASWHAQRLEVPRPDGHAWRLDSRQESFYLPNPRKRRRCLPPVRGVPPSDGAPLRRPWQAAQSHGRVSC